MAFGNCIYLSDDANAIKKGINNIVSFPREINAPGILENNVVFTYLEAFATDESFKLFYPEFANLDELKKAYSKGGIGDGRVKKFLFEVINAELLPIRERRKECEKSVDLMQILQEGTKVANEVANKILNEVKHAMKIDYF